MLQPPLLLVTSMNKLTHLQRTVATGLLLTGLCEHMQDLEAWAERLLPSRQFGFVIITTSAGIMDHEEARRKKVGGKVLGFFY